MDLHEDCNKHGPDFSEDAQRPTEQSEGQECLVMPEFSQGVCKDGAAILMDGSPLTIEELLERLRRGVCDEIDAARYRKLRVKNWTERGMVVVEKSTSVKLGHMTVSHGRLDAALDAEA